MALYFLLMAGFEILWLQPWTMHTYIDPSGGPSHTYNAYTLDAMYNTMYVLPMVLAMLMSYLVTSGIMALWAKLPRPKRIVSEKPS